MNEIVAILHFLGFGAGLGTSLSNLILGRVAAGADAAARPALEQAARGIGIMGVVALLLLWATGAALVYLSFGGWAGLPGLFWVKLAAVLALTGCVVLINLTAIRAARAGTPPPGARMRLLGQIAALSGIAAMALAVFAFRG